MFYDLLLVFEYLMETAWRFIISECVFKPEGYFILVVDLSTNLLAYFIDWRKFRVYQI